jgi:nucleoside-diphosphate-sugar epimerase
MVLPGLLVTGASGFVGRALIPALLDDWRVAALARRAEGRSGISPHPNLTWLQADVADGRQLAPVLRRLKDDGGVAAVIHLAAHPPAAGGVEEAWRTNVIGLRNVLELAVQAHAREFIYLGAIEACRPTGRMATVTEVSLPQRRQLLAATTREAEAMLFEFADRLKPLIVRAAGLFSDWCENATLFARLEAWRSPGWTRNVLCGDGSGAAPYLHINDLVLFLVDVVAHSDELERCEVLLASPDTPVSERELFDAFTIALRGARAKPLFVPRGWCRAAAAASRVVGRISGRGAWNVLSAGQGAESVLAVDASRTRRRLDWAPRPRLELLRRLTFLVENLRVDPFAWAERNQGRLETGKMPVHLRIHWLLEFHQEAIFRRFHELLTGPRGRERFPRYQGLSVDQHEWHHRLALRSLLNAVRTQDRGVFMGYCRDLAEQRMKEGFTPEELCGALEVLNLACWHVLRSDPETQGMRQALFDTVTSTLRSGCDQAQEVFDRARARERRHRKGIANYTAG